LLVYDRDRQWTEAFRDENYDDRVLGLAFGLDGRLAAADQDGKIRLYDRNFSLSIPPKETAGGRHPFRIAFSPDGNTLAVGYDDVTISLYDGHSLEQLPGPNLAGLIDLGFSALDAIAFSKDGATLYSGGGGFVEGFGRPVLAWAEGGHGERRILRAGQDTVRELAALPDGGLLIATADPILKVLENDDTSRWVNPSPKADMRDQCEVLAVSQDGTVVDFGFEQFGKLPLRFDLSALKLSPALVGSVVALTVNPTSAGACGTNGQ
jgi:hypothetical protein